MSGKGKFVCSENINRPELVDYIHPKTCQDISNVKFIHIQVYCYFYDDEFSVELLLNRFVQLIEVFYCVKANIKFKGRVGYERDFLVILHETLRLPCGLQVLGNLNITIVNKRFTLWAEEVVGKLKDQSRLVELNIRDITEASHCEGVQSTAAEKFHITFNNNDYLNGRNRLAIYTNLISRSYEDSLNKYGTLRFANEAHLLLDLTNTDDVLTALQTGRVTKNTRNIAYVKIIDVSTNPIGKWKAQRFLFKSCAQVALLYDLERIKKAGSSVGFLVNCPLDKSHPLKYAEFEVGDGSKIFGTCCSGLNILSKDEGIIKKCVTKHKKRLEILKNKVCLGSGEYLYELL
ncbi:DgyrCDS9093 [Dimorphilus gyrociliatus]|uniref:DgyrCDS9093 n=1 Tax=Dimorphilus gyrociliatus TaxID=2664684 RepID=A0A7I8VYA4_9ANNE|nr:DgyrCDS9093 [Dimorphilus gyrociliatus]